MITGKDYLRPIARGLTLGLLGALLLAGCGGEESYADSARTESSSGESAAPLSPEELRAADAAVADGLGVIQDLVDGICNSLAADRAKAKDLDSRIEDSWKPIEGTIKANDQEAYLAFEDSFAVIGNAVESGDSAKARAAADVVIATADDYVAAHPAGGTTSSPAPSPTSTG